MATPRTQNQSQGRKGNSGSGSEAGQGDSGQDQLLGVTEDGEEVSATLDDDEGGLSAPSGGQH